MPRPQYVKLWGMKDKVETEVTLLVVPGICLDFGYFPKIEEGPPNTIILIIGALKKYHPAWESPRAYHSLIWVPGSGHQF